MKGIEARHLQACASPILSVTALALVCAGCNETAAGGATLREVSGVVRNGQDLLIVDDGIPGAYFRFPLGEAPASVIQLQSNRLIRAELPGSNLALDLEAIEVLADGRVVVLSERLRALVGAEGLLAEYPGSLGEFATRGLEGLAVQDLPDGASRVAALWEGGCPDPRDLTGALDALTANRALPPLVVIHELEAGQRGVNLKLDEVELVTLHVPNQLEQEPCRDRFRAPDLVWDQTDASAPTEDAGFIVLLSSEDGDDPRIYLYHWLQRFDRRGSPRGEPIDLDALAPEHLRGANWEGLDWFEPGRSLVIVCESPVGSDGVAMVVDLPESWNEPR